jgi:hypothetical protein
MIRQYFARYQKESGRIMIDAAWISCPEDQVDRQLSCQPLVEGEALIRCEEPALHTRHWVVGHPDTPTLAERPEISFSKTEIAADGEDTATLSLPEPFTVEVDGVRHSVDTAPYTVAIRSAMPAVYRVRIDHWPYKAIDVEIVAHAP